MLSTADTIDGAIAEFSRMKGFAPFKFGGRWFVAQTPKGFRAVRTKSTAIRAAGGSGTIWMIEL